MKSNLILCKLNVTKQHFPIGGLNNRKYIQEIFPCLSVRKHRFQKSIRLLYWSIYLCVLLDNVLCNYSGKGRTMQKFVTRVWLKVTAIEYMAAGLLFGNSCPLMAIISLLAGVSVSILGCWIWPCISAKLL